MASSADLQRQCHELLSKLKTNQMTLRQELTSDRQTSSLENNLETHLPEKKPDYARQKLKSIMKQKNGGSGDADRAKSAFSSTEKAASLSYPDKPVSAKTQPKTKPGTEFQQKSDVGERIRLVQGEKESKQNDAMQDYFESRTTDSLMEGGTDSFLGVGTTSTEDKHQQQSAAKPTTPVSVRRRRIIDQNVHVDSKLSEADLRELEKDVRGLNFSYSQAAEDDDIPSKGQRQQVDSISHSQANHAPFRSEGENTDLTYHKSLVDRGNNRQLNNFIKDTTIKPKSLLNSTQSFSSNYSKQGPGVSFQSSASTSSNGALFRSQAGERRMLGYDWIAALIDNDAGLMEDSESFFQELREFRRCNRDECCNDFYMEGPFTLVQTEPPAVEKAIHETKVRPFTVNERLFTVPVTENLLGEPLEPDSRESQKVEPTQDDPRFVRVSIPRSTLQLPYKVRAHRRRSFDASDSCALTDHCLMGWNAVSPATLPTASSVSLTDAMSGVNPKHTTTMAEAEKAASTFHWPLLTDPRPRADSLPTWRKQYMDTTMNFVQPDTSSLSLSSSLAGSRQGAAGSGNVRQKTDALLNSTYSMMYEMQKAREQREDERLRQTGKVAS